MKFKIEGVGIDLSTTITKLNPNQKEEVEFGYIHIDLRNYSNWPLIMDFVKSQPNSSLVITCQYYQSSDEALMRRYLEVIDRTTVDLYLYPSSEFSKIPTDIKMTLGVSNPKTVEELEAIKDRFEYVSLNLSPLQFNYEIISWCESNGKKILGFNPFGGNINSAAMIESFTTNYLLSFSANYSTIVFLSGMDVDLSKESMNFLSRLIGTESSSVFELKKSVNKLYKPIKKAIKTSLVFNDNGEVKLSIPFDSPKLIYDPSSIELGLGKVSEKLLPLNKEKTKLEELIEHLLEILYYPEGISDSEKYEIQSLAVYGFLTKHFQNSIIKVDYLSNTVMGFEVTEIIRYGFMRLNKIVKTHKFVVTLNNIYQIG